MKQILIGFNLFILINFGWSQSADIFILDYVLYDDVPDNYFNFFGTDFDCNSSRHQCNLPTEFGYTFDPFGNLFGIRLDRYIGDDTLRIFKIDLSSCTIELYYSVLIEYEFPEKLFTNRLPIFTDYQGTLYVPFHRSSLDVSDILKIKHFSNKDEYQATFYEFPISGRLEDFNLIGNEIYVISGESKKQNYVSIYDLKFNLLQKYKTNRIIKNLVQGSECGSFISAIGFDMNKAEYESKWDPFAFINQQLYLFTYDLENDVILDKCPLYLNSSGYVKVISPTEFLGSDPECDLLIDLDRDNSSGVLPYDYYSEVKLCTAGEVSICDDDLFIHTSIPMDSIVLVLKGGLDVGEEFLQMETVSGIELNSRNDSTYVISSGDKIEDEEIKEAISSVKYIHTGVLPTPGIRVIELKGFSAVKTGVSITATLEVSGPPVAGKDTTIFICSPLVFDGVSKELGGDLGGIWEPGFTGGGDDYNSAFDILPEYLYIIETENCGSDTASFVIMREEFREIDLPSLPNICKGEVLHVDIPILDGDMVEWEDGEIGASRDIVEPGEYQFTIHTQVGCALRDTVLVFPKFETIEKVVSVCPGQKFQHGEVLYQQGDEFSDTLFSLNMCDTIIEYTVAGRTLTHDVRTVAICEGEEFLYTDGSSYDAGETIFDFLESRKDEDCDTLLELKIVAIPNPVPKIEGERIICFGTTTELTASDHKLYEWSTGAESQVINVGGGQYNLTVIDTLNCSGSTDVIITERPEWHFDFPDTFEMEKGEIQVFLVDELSERIQNIEIVNGQPGVHWNGNNLEITGLTDQMYTLIFTDDIGCIVEHHVFTKVIDDKFKTTANVFSPNSIISENKSWSVPLRQGQVLESLHVFDRYGNVAFFSNTEANWDGRINNLAAEQGVYVYRVVAVDAKGERSIKTGSLLVLE